MKNLIIVESPSKSKTIQKYLGKDFEVVSSKGHIRDLSTKGKGGLGVDTENGFKPDYIVLSDKKKTVSDLKKKAKEADHVYLASDPDREGEAIAWHLADELNLSLEDNNRIEFHEITKNAVVKALENPRKVDMNLVKSQETRRILDRIIGFKLSNVLQRKIKSKSAGRVQSVALRLICDREHEIENFVPEEYWTIKAVLLKDSKEITAELTKDKSKKVTIANKEEADAYIKRIVAPVILGHIVKDKKIRKPYLPFTTSTLQQEASTKLSFPAKKTMQIAQSLYEGVDIGNGPQGLITYMRTDSTRLSNEFVSSAKDYIRTNYGEKYLGIYRESVNNNAQDAHEAIRPTSIDNIPEKIKEHLNADQYKLYSFIYYRALASLMANAENATTNYEFNVDSLCLNASGSLLSFDGFLKVYHKYDSSKDVLLPEFNEGDEFDVKEILPEQKFTEGPLRYTEARLIKALEEENIGRPSTYATIVDTIKERKYVVLEKSSEKSKTKVFFPTEQGLLTDDKLKEFFLDFINVPYTAEMEKDLDEIAEAKKNTLDVLTPSYNKLMPLIENALANMEKLAPLKVGRKCPECGEDLVYQTSRYGKFVACGSYPKCKYIEKEEKKVEYTGEKCPDCGSDLIYKKGKYSTFIGCFNYPKCTYIKPKEENETVLKAGDLCPECGKVLVEKEGRYGKYVACENYPECRFTVKGAKKKAVAIERVCPECGKQLVIRTSKKGEFIGCSGWRPYNKGCNYTEKINNEES